MKDHARPDMDRLPHDSLACGIYPETSCPECRAKFSQKEIDEMWRRRRERGEAVPENAGHQPQQEDPVP